VAERISEGEQSIMEVLWADSPLTAAEVAERVTDRDWNVSTVKTMLSRLLAKNVLAHDANGRTFVYRPAVSRDAYVADESGRFVDRLFGGRATPLVAHLAGQNRLTTQDIEELETLLKALKP
jgi:BlaI family transcriptional regulator, penicillinase repressor